MTRLCYETSAEVEAPRVDRFLEKVVALSRKHRLSIAHEDTGGAFIVTEFDESNIEWLLDAYIE